MTQVREKFTATEYLKGMLIFAGVIVGILLIGAFISLFSEPDSNSCSSPGAEASQYCDSTRQGP